MRWLIGLVFLATLPCWGAKSPRGLSIKTEFSFKDDTRNVQTSNRLLVYQKMNQWVALNQAENGVILLGKKGKLEDGVIQMDFMVIDTKKTPIEINRPSLRAALGEEAEITVGETDPMGNELGFVKIKFLAEVVGKKKSRKRR